MAEIQVFLMEDFENTTDLTRFMRAKVTTSEGRLQAKLVHGNGSGDLTSLTMANGFVMVSPKQAIAANERVMFIPTRRIV